MKSTVSAAEVKVLIVFLYYFIIGVVSLTFFTIASKDITDIRSDLTAFFGCESQGIQPGRTCERNVNRMMSETGVMVVYLLLGFYPVINLVYVVSFQDIKSFLKRLRQNNSSSHDMRSGATKEK